MILKFAKRFRASKKIYTFANGHNFLKIRLYVKNSKNSVFITNYMYMNYKIDFIPMANTERVVLSDPLSI